MQLKINSCGVSDCAPDWKWTTAPHGFGDYDLWAVFRGVGHLSYRAGDASGDYHIREGACLLLAPDIFYTALHDPSRPLLVINVHFDFLTENGEPMRPTWEPEAKSVSSPLFFKTLLTRTVALFNSNKREAASAFFLAALEEFRSADALGGAEAENVWTHIINEIREEIDSARRPSSLSELSRKYGYSERYIGKMFKKLTGLSFSDYMLNSRISKAKTLLRLTDAPLGVIAGKHSASRQRPPVSVPLPFAPVSVFHKVSYLSLLILWDTAIFVNQKSVAFAQVLVAFRFF